MRGSRTPHVCDRALHNPEGLAMKAITACIWSCVIFCGSVSVLAQGQSTAPVYTNKARFAIPFRSDPAEIQRLGAREVRLFVTVDGGRNWHQVQSAAPAAQRFTVRAPKDGRYQFCVRTIDRQGRRHPEAELAPELAVVVDTKSPTLSLRLSEKTPGRVDLVWDASDDRLDTSSLQLESRQAGDKHWKRVYVSQTASGRTSWDVPGGGVVEVRGRISDQAANVAVAQDSVRVSVSATNVPRQSVPQYRDPVGSDPKATSMPDRFPRLETPPGKASPKLTPRTPTRQISSTKPIDNGGPSLGNSEVKQKTGNDPEPLPHFPQAPREQKPVVQRNAPPRRVVNRRSFRLNYAIGKVGRSGVDSVELFITTDNGAKWYRYGTDGDRKSPFPVTVPQDGRYGFAIRVRSGVGITEPPPRHGDAPEIVVVVDQTPPTLELMPILQGRGIDANKFLIRWKSSEANPAKDAIAIAYSESPNGPWKPITGWIGDAGRYLWTTPGDIPPRLYVRVAARDQSGNVSFSQTPRPIIVDTVRPSAKITTVDPDSVER